MKNIGIKILFILNSIVYFLILNKGWSYLFNDVLPVNPIITIVGVVGIFVVLLPISLLITHKLFQYVRENYKVYDVSNM